MKPYIKSKIQTSQILNYNLLDREKWISEQAKLVPAGSDVLDAGAGSCPFRGYFSHCEYKTQDFTNLESNQLRDGGYGQIDYVCDITSIPVPDASFDVILCTEVIEHVSEPIKVIYEFARILKPGGRLLLTAPLGSGIHQEPFHFYGGYTPFWYQKFLQAASFSSIDIKENGGSLRGCAQETVRFVQLSYPFNLPMPLAVKLLWLPFWLILLPFLGILTPTFAKLLDKYDKDKRFTIGYHVTAVRDSGSK